MRGGIFKLSPSFVVGLSQLIEGLVNMHNLSINMTGFAARTGSDEYAVR